MRRFRLEIFEPKTGYIEPQRRETHEIHALDNAAAKAEAQRIYDSLAAEVTLTNFALWDDAGNLVCETVRKDTR
jgi:hypothetical protein